jgi:DNA-binding beta-propeller fold protein YncE
MCVKLSGSSGPDGCGDAPALVENGSAAITPDGGQLLVASGTDPFTFFGHGQGYGGLVALAREASTGAISPSQCLSSDGSDGAGGETCDPATALNGASSIAISPDGTAVAVGARGAGSLTLLRRDPATGQLAELGCLQQFVPYQGKCRTAPVLEGVSDVAFTPDGRDVLALSPVHNALVQFHVGADGASQVRCLSSDGTSGSCSRMPQLGGINAMAVGPDGKQVYLRTGAGMVWLARDTDTGALTAGGCVDPARDGGACTAAARPGSQSGDPYVPYYSYADQYSGAAQIVLSADGHSLYTRLDQLEQFARDDDGSLHAVGCYVDQAQYADAQGQSTDQTGTDTSGDTSPRAVQAGACTPVEALSEPGPMAITPDGASMLVGNYQGVTVLSRAADGTLTGAGCLSETDQRCGSAPGANMVLDLVSDPAGRFVYVVGLSTVVVIGQAPQLAPAGAARAVIACAIACDGTLQATTVGDGLGAEVLARGPARPFRLRAGARTALRVALPRHHRGRLILVATPRRRARLGRATLGLGRIGSLPRHHYCLHPGCRLFGAMIGSPGARAGRFAAFVVRSRHSGGTTYSAIGVVDMAHRRVTFLASPQAAGRNVAVPRLVVKSDGAVAWLSCPGLLTHCAAAKASEVHVHDAVGTRVLSVAARRIGLRLELAGSTLTYEVAGQERREPLR